MFDHLWSYLQRLAKHACQPEMNFIFFHPRSQTTEKKKKKKEKKVEEPEEEEDVTEEVPSFYLKHSVCMLSIDLFFCFVFFPLSLALFVISFLFLSDHREEKEKEEKN